MQEYWVAFSLVPGFGAVRIRQLSQAFPDLGAAWDASPSVLAQAQVPPRLIEQLQTARRQLEPLRLLQAVHQAGAWVLTLDDSAYPPLLARLNDAPPVLYGHGDLIESDYRALTVVGTRRPTRYGQDMTRYFVGELVRAGLCIVSGLALGIDGLAHQTALEAGGRTLAVLGGGLDKLYPAEHRGLAQKITAQGALLSEQPLGTKPLPQHFPARNRILSGLSLGVLVIEAPEKSGSLMTASYAGEQGREVFAVPGGARALNSRGTNRLIQDGAKLVMEVEDILRELNLLRPAAIPTPPPIQQLPPLNEMEQQLLAALRLEALHVDELSRQCHLPIQAVNAALVLMELQGLVYQVSPMVYQSLV
jgi:DNA processing protein